MRAIALFAVGLAFIAGLTSRLPAADWKTGPALQRQLAAPLSITWAGNPLRRAMTGLAESQQVAIFLDRRLDPERKLNFAAHNHPLERALEDLAAREQLGVSFLGP